MKENKKKEQSRILAILAVSLVIIFLMGTIVFLIYKDKDSQTVNTNTTNTNVTITENDTLKEAIAKVYDAVVVVESYSNGQLYSTGSGFIYKVDDQYGYIITNAHVIATNSGIKIVNNNSDDEIDATLLGSDEFVDIAVLRVDKSAILAVATTGSSIDASLGDTVFTVGAPGGVDYKGTVTKGILSGKSRQVEVSLTSGGSYVMEVLQTDAAINPGNSGGPLVNINGEVIGITSMKLVNDDIEGMGFAIPIEYVMSAVEYLEAGEAIKRPALGVNVTDISAYTLYYYGISLDSDTTYGSVIVSVVDNYPASSAGLKKGDVIIAIDDTKIINSAYFRTELYKHNVGDTIKITYKRGSQTKTVEVTLSSAA